MNVCNFRSVYIILYTLVILFTYETYSNYGFSVICLELRRVYLIFIEVELFKINRHNMDPVSLQVKRCCQWQL